MNLARYATHKDFDDVVGSDGRISHRVLRQVRRYVQAGACCICTHITVVERIINFLIKYDRVPVQSEGATAGGERMRKGMCS